MRATSFGFGERVQMLNKEEGAPLGSYESRVGFASSQQRRRGFSFSQHPRRTFENMVECSNPGPGKYIKSLSSLGKTAYSLRWKTADPLLRGRNVTALLGRS